LFKIVSEGAIAAGIRRIEAITADRAEEWWEEKLHLLEEISDALKNPKDLLKGVKNLVDETHMLRREMAEFSRLKAGQLKDELLSKAESVNGIRFIGVNVDLDADSVKNLAFELRSAGDDLFIVLASESEGKASLTIAISDHLVKEKKLNAGAIIREVAKAVQGGGGGQPHIATAGGKDPAGIPMAIEKARGFLL
jgi:alanyl-tRNA synthetase